MTDEKITHVLTSLPRPAATNRVVCCAAMLSFASLRLWWYQKCGEKKIITCLIKLTDEKITHVLTLLPRPAATTHGVCCTATLSFASLRLWWNQKWGKKKIIACLVKLIRNKNYAITYLPPLLPAIPTARPSALPPTPLCPPC